MLISFKYKIILVVSVISIIFLISTLLLLYLQYNDSFYSEVTETQCSITKHEIQESECIDNKNQYYTCYFGSIYVSYNDSDNKQYEQSLTAYCYSYDNVNDDLNKNYPVSNKITCYYNTIDPINIKLHNDNHYLLIFTCFILYCSCSAIFLISSMILRKSINFKFVNSRIVLIIFCFLLYFFYYYHNKYKKYLRCNLV